MRAVGEAHVQVGLGVDRPNRGRPGPPEEYSPLCADRIRDLTRLMKPHANLPAVRDFVERAKAFTE